MNYLTFGDQPSGVYAGQVTDVCRFLSAHFGIKVRLIAFISMRGFLGNRRKIKAAYPRSWVIPAFPGLKRWRWNLVSLCLVSLFLRRKGVLARGVLATSLALQARKKGFLKSVAYDGRGAWQAELKEFEVTQLPELVKQAFDLEKAAVLETDFRLSVSNALLAYWRKEFAYAEDKHIVVPCTLNSDFPDLASEARISRLRKERGYQVDEVVLVYSGSSAGWQGLENLEMMLKGMMQRQANLKVLLLAQLDIEKLDLYNQFPGRVSHAWVNPEQVHELLAAADYGLLIREQSVTNAVSSPTKFAEYLSCGLPVLISPGIGDFSEFVQSQGAGIRVEGEVPDLPGVSYSRKQEMAKVGKNHFEKEVYAPAYARLLNEFRRKSSRLLNQGNQYPINVRILRTPRPPLPPEYDFSVACG